MAGIPIRFPKLNRRAWLFAGSALALLAVFAGVLPWFAGYHAEEAVRAAIARGPAGFRAALTHYERGWWHTDARTSIRHAWLPLELEGTHRIHHGPFVAGGAHHRVFIPVAALIESEFTGVPNLRGETSVSLDGAMAVQLASPGRLMLNLAADRDWETLRIALELPALDLKGPIPGSSAALRALSIEGEWSESAARAYVGETRAHIGELAIAAGGGQARLQGVTVTVRSAADGDLLSARIQGRADTTALGSATFAAELRNWDAAAVRRTENELAGLAARNLTPVRRQEAILEEFARFMGTLARRRVSIEMQELALGSGTAAPQGKGRMSVIGIPDNRRPTPARLLRALRAEASFRTSAEWVKPLLAPLVLADLSAYGETRALSAAETAQLTPEVRERIVSEALPLYLGRHPVTRWLRAEDGGYVVRVVVRDGQLLINGSPPY